MENKEGYIKNLLPELMLWPSSFGLTCDVSILYLEVELASVLAALLSFQLLLKCLCFGDPATLLRDSGEVPF